MKKLENFLLYYLTLDHVGENQAFIGGFMSCWTLEKNFLKEECIKQAIIAGQWAKREILKERSQN